MSVLVMTINNLMVRFCYIHIYRFMQIYTYICWIHTDAMNNRHTQQNIYLSIYCKGSKRVTQGLRVRGSWRPNRNCNILTPNLWLSTLCLSRSPGAQPEVQRPLCWVMAFFTASYQHLLRTSTHQGPKAPSAWCGFPYHISSITPFNLQLNWPLTSVLTALYNNSTPTRSPTRSLKSNV